MFFKNNDIFKNLIKIIILSKICFLIAIILGYFFFPFNVQLHDMHMHYPMDEKVNLSTTFKTWDGQQYMYLADKGYNPNQGSNVFFPLYPFLIKISSLLVFNNSLAAAIFLSNLFSIIAVIFMFKLVEKLYGESIGFISCIFLLSFPTSFYMNLVYTESLFLMLSIMFFYYLYQNNFIIASLLAFILPLSRPQGIMIVLVLILYILINRPKPILKYIGVGVMFILGFLLYLIIMKETTGFCFSGLMAQKLYVSNSSISNIFNIVSWIKRNFIEINFKLHGFTNSIIDRLFFFGFLGLLYFAYKHLDKLLLYYVLVIGLIPAFSDSFMAYTRYLLVVFPIFIILSILFKEKHYYLTVPMIVMQVVFSIAHCLNYWVA